MTANLDTNSRAPAGIDEVIRLVFRRWPMVVAISALFGIGMTIFAYQRTPIYRGTTIVAPAEKKNTTSGLNSLLGSAGGGIASLVGLGGTGDIATEEAVAVLKSQGFTEAFIRDNNLLPELFPKQWDAGAGQWKGGTDQVPTIGRGFYAFDRIRKVERDTKTGLITLKVDWKDPVKAARWSNELIDRLNKEMRSRALRDAKAAMGYLQKELVGAAEVPLREAVSRLMESEIKQEMFANVTEEYALQVVDRAIPADLDNPVKPIKTLYAAVGVVFGGMAGSVLALWLSRRRNSQNR